MMDGQHNTSDPAALHARWERIQAGFVDNPREAVTQAHDLVGSVVGWVVEDLQRQRACIEHQWSNGHDTSTEDLRQALQHYHELLNRLVGAQPRS